jgi:hypothetical protein
LSGRLSGTAPAPSEARASVSEDRSAAIPPSFAGSTCTSQDIPLGSRIPAPASSLHSTAAHAVVREFQVENKLANDIFQYAHGVEREFLVKKKPAGDIFLYA